MEKRGRFVVEEEIGTGLLFASIFKEKPANYVLICPNQYSAQRLYEFLLNFLKEEETVFFPSDELLRAEAMASSRELLSQRLYAMGQLRKKGNKVLITHPSALLRYLPSPTQFDEACIKIKVGDYFDVSSLRAKLSEIGYEASNRVDRSLQFSIRGDILDIFTVSELDPIRIEFFGDEVESIRSFDPKTQESKESKKEVLILPATDVLLNDEQLSDFAIRGKQRLEGDIDNLSEEFKTLLEQNFAIDLEGMMGRAYKGELYKYYGFAIKEEHSILEYHSPMLIYITNKDKFETAVNMLETDSSEFLRECFLNGRCLNKLRTYMPFESSIKGFSRPLYGESFAKTSRDYLFLPRKAIAAGTNVATIPITIQTYLNSCEKVVLSLPEGHQKSTVTSFLKDLNIEFEEVRGLDLPEGKLGITDFALNQGFEIPNLSIAYLSAAEFFGHRVANTRFASRFKNATVLRTYEELRPGDFVVHEYNGIGQFIDVKTIEVDGIHRDFLHIAYANNQFLYVPLEQFRLVRKYSGREGVSPKLSRLSGGDWEKKKARIKERVSDLAERLVKLYGERTKIGGFAFPPDDELQKQFEDEFPYELTKDQQVAVDEIKKDMESPEIMDRLVCGDVGFGKTEVAFRAAFKAINGGKQVAFLCPTTLLARQHYEVALSRFASFGIHVAVLSRLVPSSEQKKIIEELSKGKIDLLIGTHRLLSKEVVFKDLGLLVIDEEQRFGVEQKEKIKELKTNVDVLTLSATPIPRTLQMSLVGIRPMSEINSAPESRMPIQTYVIPYEENTVDELIQRELAREGQVFYVHNKVETIYQVASKLSTRIRGGKIGVVHGQMDKEDTEEVMERFYDGEVNVLVATSIIENGIDIPNANMIIVEDADRFGLSQLYQIKGRVGRGSRIAYAYLLYRPQKNMKEDAQKRLKAIQEFTELGAGYKIAQRDLMIRGAGDILGPEQAGFIDSVGLDLYLKMLNEAVEEKKTGVAKKEPTAHKMFSIDAYIPKDYASKSDKIELYQELEDVESFRQLSAFSKKVRDIYGRLPEEASLLIQKKKIDLLVDYPEFKTIDENEKTIDITMSDSFSRKDGVGNELFEALLKYLSIIRVSFVERHLRISVTKKGKWMDDLENILICIHKVAENAKS